MPTKLLGFRETPTIFTVNTSAPWYVYIPSTGEYKRAADLVPGDQIHIDPDLPVGQRIPLWEDSADSEYLTVASATIEFDFRESMQQEEVESRSLDVGDHITNSMFGTLRVAVIDHVGGFVTFHDGTRLTFHALSSFTHDNGDLITPMRAEPPTPVAFVAQSRGEFTVFHIPTPGWYNLPGIGPYDLTTIEADTYVDIHLATDAASYVTTHDGADFRLRYSLIDPSARALSDAAARWPSVPDRALFGGTHEQAEPIESVSEEGPPMTLRQRLSQS